MQLLNKICLNLELTYLLLWVDLLFALENEAVRVGHRYNKIIHLHVWSCLHNLGQNTTPILRAWNQIYKYGMTWVCVYYNLCSCAQFSSLCRYVEVLPGDICCVDNINNRVNIGYGDTCCHSVPFSSDGAQICCDGLWFT